MPRETKPYRFTGTEREVTDAPRCRRALQAWDGYIVQQQIDERVKQRRRPEQEER